MFNNHRAEESVSDYVSQALRVPRELINTVITLRIVIRKAKLSTNP